MKTRLFTRKRALISSVAMLLVAMIALGTATFAWFVTNPIADASGLHMKTESGTGLLVMSDTVKDINSGAWSHNTYLNAKTATSAKTAADDGGLVKLTPVSISNSEATGDSRAALGAIYTTDAKDTDNYKQDSAASISVANSGFYSEKINTKVVGGASSAKIKLTGLQFDVVDATNKVSEAIRVAVIDTDGKIIGIFASSATGNGYIASQTYAATNPTYSPTLKTAASTGLNLSAGTAKADGSTAIRVIVYLDGEDTECYTEQVTADELINNVVVTLAIDE
jgi:hypothetical protein